MWIKRRTGIKTSTKLHIHACLTCTLPESWNHTYPKKAPTMPNSQFNEHTGREGWGRNNHQLSTKLDENAKQGTHYWTVLCLSWDCTSLPTASKFCCDSEEPAGVDHKRIWWFNVEGAQRRVWGLWVGKGVVGTFLLVWEGPMESGRVVRFPMVDCHVSGSGASQSKPTMRGRR